MAKRNPAQDDDFGFVPLSDSEGVEFTPEEKAVAEKKMAKGMFPSVEPKEEDFGFTPDFEIPEGEPMSLEEVKQTGKDVITTLPQGVTTWMDEIQAMAQAGGKKAFGAEEPLMDIYEQDVGELRKGISEARNRSPWATTIGEAGIGMASSLIPIAGPLGKAASIASAGKLSGIKGMAQRGAFEGVGATESLDPWEVGIYGGAGALAGGLTGVASQGLKAATSQSSAKLQASALGARTSQFKEIGIKEREQLAKDLNNLGLFQKYKTKFNTQNLKWEPKGTKLENVETPTREKLLDRVNEAFEESQQVKNQKFSDVFQTPINKITLVSRLQAAADNWADQQSGVAGRKIKADQIVKELAEDISTDANSYGYTVGALEKARVRLKNDVGTYGKNPLLNNINDVESLYKDLYTQVNKTLNDSIQDPAYKKINELQSKLYTAKGDLIQAIAAEPPSFRVTDVKSWGKSPETMLDVAETAKIFEKPGVRQLKKPLMLGTSELPFAALRFLDPSIPEPDNTFRMDRSPDSIQFNPREIINYKVPRSTQGILENKDKVLAKFVQKGIPDEMVETFTMALNGDSEDIANIMPLIMTQMPEMFEKSKYKTFDGKFLDPNDKAKAADSISKRDDLNSIERARMINKINKNNEVPEGL